ncbi:hypothetical protein X759_12715 [Mesorhizobium sp. LSHC420B00]|nr:hypothetical protein X759_12715 [Mesorhizobium sp. LSHC420B00]
MPYGLLRFHADRLSDEDGYRLLGMSESVTGCFQTFIDGCPSGRYEAGMHHLPVAVALAISLVVGLVVAIGLT